MATIDDARAIKPLIFREPKSHRDASGASDKWPKTPPTPITVPSNSSYNPYTRGRLSDTLHGHGNRTAQATVTGHKRRKLSHDSTHRGQRQLREKRQQKVNKPLLAPEVIDLEEDLGQQVPSSDRDELDTLNTTNPGPIPHELTNGEFADDPIQQDGDRVMDFRHHHFPKLGHVSQTTKKFERLKDQEAPKLVFTAMRHGKKSLAASMKPKGGVTTSRIPPHKPPDNDPLTKSTKFTATKTQPFLPVIKLNIGGKIVEGAYQVSWNEQARTVTIKLGSKDNMLLNLDAFTKAAIGAFESQTQNDPVVRLESGSSIGGRPAFNSNNHKGSFEPGHPSKGVITIMFTGKLPFSHAYYEQFKKVVRTTITDVENIRGSSRALWVMAASDPLDDDFPPETLTNGVPPQQRTNRKRKASSDILDLSNQEQRDSDSRSSTTIADEMPPPSTRRSTRQSDAKQKKAPSEDPEEVILVYPSRAPGAVPISNYDLARLAPGEFLNDTVIEFGLKLWFSDLQENDPTLAESIHIFNSFFYKKLNKKNLSEGYQNVKRWTAKVDIFSKKIIIVPINENLHWYLAIIYMPEHVLLAPVETHSPTTRGKARASAIVVPSTDSPAPTQDAIIENQPALEIRSHSPDNESVSGKVPPSSEGQVADALLNFTVEHTRTTDDAPPNDTMDCSSPLSEPPPSPNPMRDNDEDELRLKSIPPSPTATEGMEDLKRRCDDITIVSDSEEERLKETGEDVQSDLRPDGSIPPPRFYGKSAKAKWKTRNASSQPQDFPDEPHVLDMEVDTKAFQAGGHAQTYIFTMDSLGSRHPKVVTTLAQYLQLEAKERKGLDNTSKAMGKVASVPPQPNFCDCGIYLLHYAQVFCSDHAHFSQLILNPPKRTSNIEERNTAWKVGELQGFREKLTERIRILSQAWKQSKEEQKKQEPTEIESSDSEIDIVDTTPAQRKGKGGKSPTKATRLR